MSKLSQRLRKAFVDGCFCEDRVDYFAYCALRVACFVSVMLMVAILILAFSEIVVGIFHFFGYRVLKIEQSHFQWFTPLTPEADRSSVAVVRLISALEYLWLALLVYLLPRSHSRYVLSGLAPDGTVGIDARAIEQAHKEFHSTKSLSTTLLIAILATWIIKQLIEPANEHNAMLIKEMIVSVCLLVVLVIYYSAMEMIPKLDSRNVERAKFEEENFGTMQDIQATKERLKQKRIPNED